MSVRHLLTAIVTHVLKKWRPRYSLASETRHIEGSVSRIAQSTSLSIQPRWKERPWTLECKQKHVFAAVRQHVSLRTDGFACLPRDDLVHRLSHTTRLIAVCVRMIGPVDVTPSCPARCSFAFLAYYEDLVPRDPAIYVSPHVYGKTRIRLSCSNC